MIFTSWAFFVFLGSILVVYFSLSRWWRWQNAALLVASYVFYAFWDWRFLGLLFGMTVVNYAAGWAISRQPDGDSGKSRRRLWLGLAISIDLCVLAAFKYFKFFGQSLSDILTPVGIHLDPVTLSVILPLGISFFTFMAITYPFDIHRGKMQHTRRFSDFALFVSFFPTIVSGPVERASHMLPQFQSPRRVTSDHIGEAIWLITWGFFQKLVIADNVSLIANRVFDNYGQFHGLDIIVAILAYTIQILADFGGYTDIARGVARLFGFELLLNFNVPYYAISPSDFWSRWHISLSQWFREYLYIPLGGNRKGALRTNVNLVVTMVLVGLWHGAAWTFILWGAWHGVLQVVYRVLPSRWQNTDRSLRTWWSLPAIVGRTGLMLVLVAAGWTAFRSDSFTQLAYLFAHAGFGTSVGTGDSLWKLAYFGLPMIAIQALQVRNNDPLFMIKVNPWVRGVVYGVLITGIIIFSQREITRFIYQGF